MTGLTDPGDRSRDGFTLIEMLFVLLFTAIVLSIAINAYLQLSRQSSAAAALTEGDRRATLTLDRIARDLQETVLIVKPDEVDPLAHPWLFLAEAGRSGEGADRLKFQTRAHRPRGGAEHESDLAVVAFWTALDERGEALELLRWSSPQLPESLDQAFPRRDDQGVQVLADGVASFGIRLQDEDGAWTDRWNSSTLERSSQLPVQAELQLALLDPESLDGVGTAPPDPRVRRVLLPIRPLDLAPEESGEPDEEGDDEDDDAADCVTVAQCRAANPEVFDAFLSTDPALEALIDAVGGECFAEQAASLGIDPGGLAGCQ
ncbi:MAG: hypothetical protein CL910_03210 [Deltaproteobacteria bacterium]|nr:hypothetical protein [Deltaproteobacteria bacterium]